MQMAKSFFDELSFMGAPVHSKDLTFKILNGLPDVYKEISNVVRACETVISFNMLHEKLITCEALLNEHNPNA